MAGNFKAMIAILAHMGSFVPAESVHIGVIDQGSTIMVGNSNNQATYLGRGTGVYDGQLFRQ